MQEGQEAGEHDDKDGSKERNDDDYERRRTQRRRQGPGLLLCTIVERNFDITNSCRFRTTSSSTKARGRVRRALLMSMIH